MKQSRIFLSDKPPGMKLEVIIIDRLNLFCKYSDNTHVHSSKTTTTTSTIRRKRKKNVNFTKMKNYFHISTNAFYKTPIAGVCLFILFGLTIMCPSIDAQVNETGHNQNVPNRTVLSNNDNTVIANDRRLNTRLSVLKYDTIHNSTQHLHRPLHNRSYHFAKVLLLSVQSKSKSNGSTLISDKAKSLPAIYATKHTSIKRKRSGRYRRLTPAASSVGGGPSAALNSFHPKIKSGSAGPIPGLGPLPSSTLSGQGRLKILTGPDLGPQGPYGPVVPDSKCNYELYPSGCFDENGSVCDSNDERCVCRPGHSIQLEGLYCLRPATIGEACYTTEQCERRVAHSGCFNYREEYRLEQPSGFFGPAQSSWPMGECRCRSGYRHEPSLGACTPALIGAWCSNAWDCQDPSWIESGSHLHHSSKPGHGSGYHHGGNFHNRSSSSNYGLHHNSGSGFNTSGSHRKAPNVVCDGNVCACASYFHFNESASECQYKETYGRICKAHDSLTSSSLSSSSSLLSSSSSSSSATNRELPIKCNPPSICSVNGTCDCPDNFEYQPNARPQCQRFKGQSSANLFGSSNRSGKGDGFFDFDRGSSSLSNFAEYVLYVLIPILLIIFAIRPCFRRIGEWRNHVHQYASDADFFQGFTRPVMSAAEMNAIQNAAEKGVSSTAAATFTFDPCHAPYLFDSAALVDSCFGFTPATHTSSFGHHRASLGPNDPSLALVREKLQTIEESQSESGGENGNVSGTASACRCGALAGVTNCCEAQTNDNDSGTMPSPGKTQEGCVTTTSTTAMTTISNSTEETNNHETNISQPMQQDSAVDSL